MALGLGIVVYWATQSGPTTAIVSNFVKRVIADGGTVESPACLRAAINAIGIFCKTCSCIWSGGSNEW